MTGDKMHCSGPPYTDYGRGYRYKASAAIGRSTQSIGYRTGESWPKRRPTLVITRSVVYLDTHFSTCLYHLMSTCRTVSYTVGWSVHITPYRWPSR